MRSLWQRVRAPLAGILGAGLVLALLESAAHAVLPTRLVFPAAALALGVAGLVGGTLALSIDARRADPWIVAVALLALSLVNVASFAHPAWFVPAAAAALALGAWLAGRAAPGR